MLKLCYFLIQINFVVEALSIILTVTDFNTDHYYFCRIKGTAKSTTCVAVCANLHVLIKN